MARSKWIILAGALAISLSVAQSGRYVVTPIGSDGPRASLIVDTWLWRTSACTLDGCREWRKADRMGVDTCLY